MKLKDFIKLAPRVKLYKTGEVFGRPHHYTYTKKQVKQMIIDQIYEDFLSKVSKKEIKERVANLIEKFEIIPPKPIMVMAIKEIFDEMKLE